MKELDYGEKIRVGDKVFTMGGLHDVVGTDNNFCYVRVNRYTSIRLPNVYSKEFKDSNDIDNEEYPVFRV